MSLAGRFPPEVVQAVRDAVDIVDLVGDHTQLKQRGRRFVGLCPFHKEKTPSFSVDPEQGLYYCFGCGAGGDAIGFHIQITGDEFGETIELLAGRYGVALPQRRGGHEQPRASAKVLELAEQFFMASLRRSQPARRYLEARRISPQLIADHRLGFAPDSWRSLLEALVPGVSEDDLERTGLIARAESGRPYDRFRNRLMFPIRGGTGRLVGFGGRTLGDDRAKYINTSETESFQKSFLLYGLDRARTRLREDRRVLLVEGYFDVLAALASGFEATVASMGTSLTRQQVQLLKRYADEVIVGYDGDRAGEEASRKALPLLLAAGLRVRRARFPAGQDPDSLRLEEGEEAVLEVISTAADAVLLEIGRIPRGVQEDPQLQAQAAATVRELLAAIPDKVLSFAYGRKAAERLGVPEALLREAPARGRQESAQEEQVSRPREVTSLEESALQLLLRAPLPLRVELPPADVFWDRDCRELYLAFRRQCDAGEGGGSVDVQALLGSLDRERATIDRVARLLLEDPPGFRLSELSESLHRLEQRWGRRRAQQLKTELLEAQQTGDHERMEELLKLKAELSDKLHGRA